MPRKLRGIKIDFIGQRRSIIWRVALAMAAIAGPINTANAHFLLMHPAGDVVSAEDPHWVDLAIRFTHPMERGPVMEMAPPRQFGMLVDGHKTDLLKDLVPQKVDGRTTYNCRAKLTRPGDHVFYLEPAPYWEPSERKMIVHYTKVVVDYLHAEEGWDAAVGLPVEIEPLVRPYGLWAGNCFRGIVKHDGRPVPFATIEVEYDNAEGRVKTPNDAFITQVIKADAQGVFTYAMPKAGWWGFAALLPGEKMKNPQGEDVEVELGGLLWVKTVKME